MEKQNNIETEKIPSASKVEGVDVEKRINSLLGVDDTTSQRLADAERVRTWRLPKKSYIHSRHRKQIEAGIEIESLEHIPNGKRKGCCCVRCLEARGDFEEKIQTTPPSISSLSNQEAVHEDSPSILSQSNNKPASISPPSALEPDNFVVDLVDEEFAGIVLDSFRVAGSMYVQSQNFGSEVEMMWNEDKKITALLGKHGKKCWDHYAKIPNFKYADLMVLGFILGRDFSLRVYGTSRILKAVKEKSKNG